MKTAALIVAAGRGARAGADRGPKQYRQLGSSTVLARTLSAFLGSNDIDLVIVAIHPDDVAAYDSAAADLPDALLPPIHGGATRQASVRAGLEALQAHAPGRVLIHDAARPFVEASLIARVCAALDAAPGALPAVAVTDTLKRADGSRIMENVDREGLYAAQTPQGFAYPDILAAHRAARDAGRDDFTDDSGLAAWYGLDVVLVEGDPANVKLTTARNIEEAEARMTTRASLNDMRVGTGFDVHAFADRDGLVLCGIAIPEARALKGHSDADVGLHAITDAVLGALGDGDIGAHFPPNDPKWAGAASSAFLADAAGRVHARGGRITHVDVTLICEAPKIGPHRDAMRVRIAEILDIEVARVSVKATTTEGLGFTGRREGIAAQSSAVVVLP